MLVSEIGEFGLIGLLSQEFGIEYPPRGGAAPRPGLLVDLGDDAVVSARREGSLIWTTDTMVAGVHFLPSLTAWRDTGWKALAVNISDIAAMGGEPFLALVTLMLPADFEVDYLLDLYRGLRDAAEAYGVTLGGGDIVRAPVFAVTVALSGWADSPRLLETRCLTRGAARLGDVVAVSGTLGDSAAGLVLLHANSRFESEHELALRRAHERPVPRLSLGRAALAVGVRCAIDVSDGLVQDLGHIARASNVGIRIEAARVPVSQALRDVMGARAMGLALTGGEDYELVLIAPRPVIDWLIEHSDTPLTAIGEVVHYETPRVAVVDETGTEIPLGRAGWDHLR
jgi:thiamine-monophosphate kinase